MAGIDADVFKALSDGNRLKIMGMLSDGEICACRILEALDITQPTLSHHMKILCSSGLVKARRSGQWSYYSIDRARLEELKEFIDSLRSR
ncbi:MAG: winged helix-turn-helix transcriptional regulator [Candidatus Methanomethylophilaceae archaeon]|nr:winged helix-turn-helix transcriptional regulator [Candidatus Methanomethylophilaceae archaeon]